MEPFDDADESNIVDFENRAKELEATEHDLLQQLQQVRYTLAHLRSRITSYLINRRAPIARLPAEILAKIFWFGDPTYKREGPLPSPVIFSHVSRHWRRVAIDTPMLWSRIHSVADTWVKHPYPHALLDAHLERSRTCRLDIDCDIDIDFFIEKIVYHIQRWSSYTFRSYGVNSTAAALSHIQALAPLCAPALRRLTVRDIPDASSDALFTGGLPRISSLTIRNSRKMMMDIIAPVAFNMLTHLKITTTFDEAYTLTKIQDVLAQTPLLIDLAIVCRRLEIDNCRETPVALPALRKFGLGMIRFEHLPHYTRQVFSAIAAPALECVTLSGIFGANSDHVDEFAEYARSSPSFPHIQTLVLTGTAPTRRLGRALPTVKHLVICDYYNDINWFSSLKRSLAGRPEDTSPPWTSLRLLTLKVNNLAERELDVSRITEERAAAGCPLHVEAFQANAESVANDEYLL